MRQNKIFTKILIFVLVIVIFLLFLKFSNLNSQIIKENTYLPFIYVINYFKLTISLGIKCIKIFLTFI